MTIEQFQTLISNPESSILDFKAELYDFVTNKEEETAKFIKDVISFSNTIREKSAYIVFGIKENLDGKKEKTGISKSVDDAIFQDKVKNKLLPIPKFSYSTIELDGKVFGVLEFPLEKYDSPIISTVRLKGVEIGKVYYRQGSTNTEALALDIIKIHTWLQSLPKRGISLEPLSQSNTNILKRVLSKREPLSEVLPDLYVYAKSKDLNLLKEFCELELKGFDVNDVSILEKIHSETRPYNYRVLTIQTSLDKIAQIYNHTPEQLKQEMKGLNNFYETPYFFKESISAIEDYLPRKNGLMTITLNVKNILPDYKKDHPLYGYIFISDIESLYQNIRQKLIDLTMEII
jgi:hypothetical protein